MKSHSLISHASKSADTRGTLRRWSSLDGSAAVGVEGTDSVQAAVAATPKTFLPRTSYDISCHMGKQYAISCTVNKLEKKAGSSPPAL